MNDDQLESIYLRYPPDPPARKRATDLAFGAAGLALSPAFLLLARLRGAPGLGFRGWYASLALRQLLLPGRHLPLHELYKLIVFPMDSVRYFEFQYVWDRVRKLSVRSYLDVSSPRLLPLLLLRRRRDIEAVLLNPDRADLPITRKFAAAMGVQGRCTFSDSVIAEAPIAEGSRDLITCISVLEHIPRDREAVRKMWSLLQPGGRLLLTVPCAAKGAVEYTDRDKYGLLGTDAAGTVFWQRYYDWDLLGERIFAEIGQPAHVEIYGERARGAYARNVQQKMRYGWRYPGWREPYFMGSEFRHFDSLATLPGMGVIGMEFRKPGAASARPGRRPT